MNQSSLHIAIIMDGNGRWAQARGWPRSAGHRAGVEAVGRVVEAAPQLGVGTLTLYAFSSDNWRRPVAEVGELMRLLGVYLRKESAGAVERGIRIRLVGRRDRLPAKLVAAVEQAEAATASGRTLELRIAVDYSSRDAILRATTGPCPRRPISRETFARCISEAMHAGPELKDVDLLIRTGGEQRLSDFLLWECAYAELVFTRRMWPEFDAGDLRAAIEEYQSRDRRFGAVPRAAAG